MSRFSSTLLFMVAILCLPSCAVQAPKTSLPHPATALASYYPQIEYQQINPTPVAGVYEIVVKNGEIVYFVPTSGHMFLGELWSADAKNLTRESKAQRSLAQRDLFPLELAIKIGTGPNQVIEVTDPDCPFCRQSSSFFAGREDVTRYIFFYPLDQLHPHAASKARYILSAQDQKRAYEEVFSGKYDSRPIPEVNDDGLLDQQRKIVNQVGVAGTPHFWINGTHVTGYNPQQFEKLLSKETK